MRPKSLILCLTIATVTPALLIGCSSDSTSSSSNPSSTSSKDAVCTARDNLKQSMTDLTDPSLLTGGKSGVESAVNKVQKNLDSFESAAKAHYKPQVDAVKSSFDQVKSAVSNLGNGKLSDNLQKIGDAISSLGTSTSSLYDAVKTECH